jgi:hypothetical protein
LCEKCVTLTGSWDGALLVAVPAAVTGVFPRTEAVEEAFKRLLIEDETGGSMEETVEGVLDTVGAREAERVERSSRLEGCVEAGSSVSRSIRLPFVPRLRVNLSPP